MGKRRDLFVVLLLAILTGSFIYFLVIGMLVNPYIEKEHSEILKLYEFYEQPSNQKEIFVLGSSQIREAVDAYLAESQLDQQYAVYNLGLSADTPLRRLTEIDLLLGRKPEMVILGYSPFDFSDKAVIPDEYLVFGNEKLELSLEQLSLFHDAQQKLLHMNWLEKQIFKRRFVFGSLTRFAEVGKNVLAKILREKRDAGVRNTVGNFKNPYVYIVNQDSGLLENKIYQPNSLLYTRPLQSTDWIQRAAMVELIDVLKQNNVTVIYVNIPFNPLFSQAFDSNIQKMSEVISGEVATHTDFYVDVSGEYTEEEFIDLSHLNEKGRIKFSSTLAEIINQEATTDALQ